MRYLSRRYWVAVKTKSGSEQKVCSEVRKRGHDAYCPTTFDQQRLRRRALFATYVLVDLGPTRQWTWLRDIRGVVKPLMEIKDAAVPTRVPLHVILGMMREQNEHGVMPLAARRFDLGDKVVATTGFMEGVRGECVATPTGDKVKVAFTLLGRQLVVELHEKHLRAA